MNDPGTGNGVGVQPAPGARPRRATLDLMNDRDRQPIAYQRLADMYRQALAEGEYADGRRLPTEAELAVQHGLSRQTVRRALQELVAEGLIYRVRGRGTFATSITPGNRYLRSFGSVDDLLAYSVDTVLETLEPLERGMDIDAASRLQLPSDEVMVALLRRTHENRPISITRVALSVPVGIAVLARGMLRRRGDKTSSTVVSVVDQVAEHPIAGAHQSIIAVRLPADIATLIGADANDPGLRIDRIYYDTTGRPVELAVSHFNPARYTYRVELSRGPRR
jgi:GntR family transcriptional regulator